MCEFSTSLLMIGVTLKQIIMQVYINEDTSNDMLTIDFYYNWKFETVFNGNTWDLNLSNGKELKIFLEKLGHTVNLTNDPYDV